MRSLFLVTIAQLVLSQSATAAIVVEFGPTLTLAPNSTASMDVYISSDTGNIDLAFAEYRFEITLSSGVPSGVVRFLPSFESADIPRQNNAEKLDGDYVFFDNIATNNFVATRQFAPNENVLDGGDSTLDLDTSLHSNVMLGSDLKLLARLEIEQVQLGGGASGMYQISLVQAKFQNAEQADVFDDSLGSLAFTSTPGMIQVGATAVPEPSSLLLCSVGLAFGYGRLRARRRSGRITNNGMANPE